jgi:mannose-1-phosphate guanylyltransferase
MAVLTADHYISDVITFRHVLDGAVQIASQGSIVTLGITPSFPATGFGYIERGRQVSLVDGIPAYELKRFTEKPSQEVAETFLRTGCYSWNSGMFIWPVQRVISEFAQHAPDIYEGLERIEATIDTPRYTHELAQVWSEMRQVSIDFAVMEHVKEGACVIPVEMGWSDIGNFEALYHVLSPQGENVSVGVTPLLFDTHRTLVHSKRLVATIGVEDLIIIDTDDIVLVCCRSSTGCKTFS